MRYSEYFEYSRSQPIDRSKRKNIDNAIALEGFGEEMMKVFNHLM